MSDESLRPAREPISKKLRFGVFKRDSFTCQYCGKKAPDVILQCDHIKPVAEGGVSDVLNLLTSCVDCNSGKGARTLAEHTTLTKQMDQLAELQTRREQIEMLIEWRGRSRTPDGPASTLRMAMVSRPACDPRCYRLPPHKPLPSREALVLWIGLQPFLADIWPLRPADNQPNPCDTNTLFEGSDVHPRQAALEIRTSS